MRKFCFCLLGILTASLLQATSIEYQEDRELMIANPERGFYTYSDIRLKGDGTGGLTDDANVFVSCRVNERSLLFRYFYLNKYNDGSPITDQDLQLIANDFEVARRNGIKLIIRFSYGSSGYTSDSKWSFTEPTKEGMLAHMAQLKPVLAANADVIACVQAGFVGIWGEWYFTSTFGKDWTKPGAVEGRNEIIDGLLDMTPVDRCIQLRSIHYITEYLGKGEREYNMNLTDETAFSGSPLSRLGHHNDAFCHDQSNSGTYYDYSKERTFLANHGQYVPLGGETNGGSVSYYKGQRAMKDMVLLHYDYMNSAYEQNVLNNWKTTYPEGDDSMSYYEIFRRRMGYRFWMHFFNMPDAVDPANPLQVDFTIDNVGFSNLYNRRVAYIVLKNETNTYYLPIKSDPRLWKAGTQTRVQENLALPDNAAEGTYKVYFAMPDVYESIANNPAFAIRLANKDMGWEDGLNDLGFTVDITVGAPFNPDWVALNKVQATPQAVKVMKDNSIVIERNNVRYNVLGTAL